MATAAEYRQFERTCLRWAADARSEEKRDAYLKLAAAYNELAIASEQSLRPPEAVRLDETG